MKHSDAILFVGKCLTLGRYPKRIPGVRSLIRSGNVRWEKVVWVATAHFVFPALYLQLRRSGLDDEIPRDLAEYMEEFTNLNRQRNQRIFNQALEINSLLKSDGINPVFLKGTAHLLDGLYVDIGERMIGDIDILIREKDVVRAADILCLGGYQCLEGYPQIRNHTIHYHPLVSREQPAAVEIHRQIVLYPYYKSIDCEEIFAESRPSLLSDDLLVPSTRHQLIHNILNVQVNDFGYYYAKIFLRQIYDLHLLSEKENVLKVAMDFGRYFHRINGNLALANLLLDRPDGIQWRATWLARWFTGRTIRNVKYPWIRRCSTNVLYILWRLTHTAYEVILMTYRADARKSVYARLRDPNWYGKHLKSYGKNSGQ